MKLRFLVAVTAFAAVFVVGRQLFAQQMSPYPPMGGNPTAAPVGYPMPYPPSPYPPSPYPPAAFPPAMPANYDVQQEAAADAQAPAADCNGCGQPACPQCACGCNCWNHKVGVFGELLYLRARNAEVAYGVPVDGPLSPIPVGPYGVVDQDYNPGFRVGFSYVMDGWSSVAAQYTYFNTDASDEITTTQGNAIRSLVSHPGTLSTTQDLLSAEANQDIKFEFVDLDYRRVLSCDDNHTATFLAGLRVGQFNQDFSATFSGAGTEIVESEIDFNGAGLRLGLEGERFSNSRRWLAYGKTYGNFVAGEFTADYWQNSNPVAVDTTWKAGRIVPMLDLEVGAGWQSRCGTWRITGGYMISAWYNAVKTDEWINAVQNNNLEGLAGSMSFDGLVLRCEGRF